jgi:hypothetical protein
MAFRVISVPAQVCENDAATRRFLVAAILITSFGAAAPAAGAPKWTVVRSKSLIVMGDQPASTLRNVAQQLEQFRVVLGGLLQNTQHAASLPTTVYVFGSHRAMETFVPLRNATGPSLLRVARRAT